ncbi:PAS domain S-box protein [Deinococcus apachensis]|uniref:PAS domain S-box protein n=1 Tax=Deinococcus apachensis TaxID=309886 RepID=UPI00036BEB41|nr:PAS domain S-box protein [Deinococcus apachensis]
MPNFPTPFNLSVLDGSSPPFQALIEHSADLITLLDRQGRILYQSPSAHRHFGCDRNPVPGQYHVNLDYLHPEDRERINQQVLHAPPGATVSLCPYRVRHADGHWRWLEGTAINLLDDPGVRGILVQARDVTARVQSEQRARALEGLSTALASANTTEEVVQVILVQGLEAVGAVAGGVVQHDVNEQRFRVLGSAGYPERIERPWRDFPLDAPIPATDAIRDGLDLFLTRQDWHTLYPHLQHVHAATTGSNAVLSLRVNGQVTGALTLSFGENRDLGETERQYLRTVAAQCALALERGELHARLQRQERHYRKLAEYSYDLVSIIAPDGTTRYISHAAGRMLGYAPEERLGVKVFEGIHPDDREEATRAFQQVIETPDTPVLVTYRFRHKEGHWVWLESTGTHALHDPDVRGVVINTRDVTGRIKAEQARRASEQRLQLFGEQSDTLIRIFSPGGTCLYASPAAQTMLGYTPGELLRSQVDEWIHPEDRAALRAALAAHTPVPPYRMRRRDGTYLWVESSARTVTDEAGGLVEVYVATRDITPRKEAEDALRTQLRRFQHLVNLTAEFAVQEASEQHIQTALDHCIDLTPYTYGFYVPVDGTALAEPLRAGQATDALLGRIAPLMNAHGSGELCGALRRLKPFFAGPGQAVFSAPEPLPRPVWTSLAVLPVVARGVLRGLMVFGTDDPVEVDGDTRRLLLGVSEQASRAVERSAHLQELKQSREETLRALGLALEYRDYETKGHTDRVVQHTERLGRALGFSGPDLDALRWGAFLHDTGKVAIPDAILLKPGRLTPEEWDVIQRHPRIGYEMLHHIPSLPPVTLEVVLHHQERWNGSGYPGGLAGTDIPLAARVFAVVDVYDALTSERPYKKAWTPEEAAEQLRKESGVLLDERIVDVFLRILTQENAAPAPTGEVSA